MGAERGARPRREENTPIIFAEQEEEPGDSLELQPRNSSRVSHLNCRLLFEFTNAMKMIKQ